MSRLLRRPLSGLGGASKLLTDDVGDRLLSGSFDFLPSLISFDFSFERPERDFASECSGEDGASEPASESSIRQSTASGLGGATIDQVGVITVVTGTGDVGTVVTATVPLVISVVVVEANGDVEPLVGG